MDTDKIRNILNIVFLILAGAAVATYFIVKDKGDLSPFLYVCGVAIVVKLMEFFIRFMR